MPAHRIGATVAAIATGIVGFLVASPSLASASPSTPAAIAPTWESGAASNNFSAFESWMGRDVAVDNTWINRATWSDYSDVSMLPTAAQQPGQLSIGVPMLPDENSANFDDCAAGDYNTYLADLGSSLDSIGRGASYIRLGWEFNGDWFKSSIANASAKTWISCWQNEVTALRSTDPAAIIVWNGNKGSSSELVGRALSYYPGDKYVDVVGVDYYDMWPAMSTQSSWNAEYNQTESDGMPVGLGAWLSFAEAHGKLLAVPEWGVIDKADGGGGDDPFYIEAMHNFFEQNAAHLAYESYFDSLNSAISGYTDTAYPNSAAEYLKLWNSAPSVTLPSTPGHRNHAGTGMRRPTTRRLSRRVARIARTGFGHDRARRMNRERALRRRHHEARNTRRLGRVGNHNRRWSTRVAR